MNTSTVTDWTTGFITGLTAGMARLFGAIPNILGAIVLLIIGWIVARIVATLVVRLCRAIHVDSVADRVGVNGFLQQTGTTLRASAILGELVKWAIFLVFVEMAAEQLGMPQVTQIINQILGFIPNIIVAVIILGVGAFLGQLLAGIVRGAAREARLANTELLARVAYGAVMAFAIIAALNELNVAPVVVNTLYIGLVAALALAIGLAFGLGGRDVAARFTERWAGRLESTTTRLQTATQSGELGSVPTVRGSDVAETPRQRTPRTPGTPP